MTSTLDKTASFVLITVLILMPVVSHAGGLGIAPLVFILGSVGLLLHLKSNDKKIPRSPVFLTLGLFLLWVCFTSLWSPYHSDDLLTNYIKLFIMGLVFYFAPSVMKKVAKTKLLALQRIFIVTTFLSAIFVTIDIWSGFKFTLLFNPASSSDELVYRIIDAEQNLGHAITVLILFSAPMTILLKLNFKIWKLLSILFFTLIFLAAWKNNLWIGIIGTAAVILTLFLAFKFPNNLPKIALFIVASSIILAPLQAFVSSQFLANDLSVIPISWEHRLRMWAYCWPVIRDNSLAGLGFDAVRTFDEQWKTRNGMNLTIVSLHPHNASIHIWTETGLIGCILVCAFIFALFRALSKFVTGRDRTVLMSGVTMGALFISVSTYGAWQFWWWSSVFFSAGLIHLIPMREA